MLIAKLRRRPKTRPSQSQLDQEMYETVQEDFPTYPPPPPQAILKDPQAYWEAVCARKYITPEGIFEDSSLYALYRLYECFVLDKVFGYRNWLEWLWRQPQWPICEIPDPKDEDPTRYAFLAGCTYLIVRSFNARVKLGLTRGNHPIMLAEEAEEARNRPDHERRYERVPQWAEDVPPVTDMLAIPTDQGEILHGSEDERADEDFLKKNILIWTPHIHFT